MAGYSLIDSPYWGVPNRLQWNPRAPAGSQMLIGNPELRKKKKKKKKKVKGAKGLEPGGVESPGRISYHRSPDTRGQQAVFGVSTPKGIVGHNYLPKPGVGLPRLEQGGVEPTPLKRRLSSKAGGTALYGVPQGGPVVAGQHWPPTGDEAIGYSPSGRSNYHGGEPVRGTSVFGVPSGPIEYPDYYPRPGAGLPMLEPGVGQPSETRYGLRKKYSGRRNPYSQEAIFNPDAAISGQALYGVDIVDDGVVVDGSADRNYYKKYHASEFDESGLPPVLPDTVVSDDGSTVASVSGVPVSTSQAGEFEGVAPNFDVTKGRNNDGTPLTREQLNAIIERHTGHIPGVEGEIAGRMAESNLGSPSSPPPEGLPDGRTIPAGPTGNIGNLPHITESEESVTQSKKLGYESFDEFKKDVVKALPDVLKPRGSVLDTNPEINAQKEENVEEFWGGFFQDLGKRGVGYQSDDGTLTGSGGKVVFTKKEWTAPDPKKAGMSDAPTVGSSLNVKEKDVPLVAAAAAGASGGELKEKDVEDVLNGTSRIWGDYRMSGGSQKQKYLNALNSMYQKAMILNVVAALTGSESQAGLFLEMASKKFEAMQGFDGLDRLENIRRGVFYTKDGNFDPPKSREEAFKRAVQFGASPAEATKLSGWAASEKATKTYGGVKAEHLAILKQMRKDKDPMADAFARIIGAERKNLRMTMAQLGDYRQDIEDGEGAFAGMSKEARNAALAEVDEIRTRMMKEMKGMGLSSVTGDPVAATEKESGAPSETPEQFEARVRAAHPNAKEADIAETVKAFKKRMGIL